MHTIFSKPAPEPPAVIVAAEYMNTLREDVGLGIPELAAMVGTDRTHLWRVLHGDRPGSPELLASLLIAIGQYMKAEGAA